MVTELREFGDGCHLVVYTESQSVRRALKSLPAFAFENTYHLGAMGPVVGVDLYLVANGDLASLKKSIDKVVSMAVT